VLGKIKNIRVN